MSQDRPATPRSGVALLLAVVLFLGPAPVSLRVARAQAPTASVAVLGVHGNGDQTDADLRALHADLVRGLTDADRFAVVTGDELRGRLEPRRDEVLERTYIEPARRAFEEGRAQLDDAPDVAVEAFERASIALSKAHELLRDEGLLVDIALHRALAHQARGDDRAARAAYADVVRMAPELVLDPSEQPRSAVALFDEARAEVLAAAGATVSVTVAGPEDPPARVHFDGRSAGDAPTTIDALPPGDHFLTVVRDGGLRWFDRLAVDAGATLELTATPTPRGLALEGEVLQGEHSDATRRLYRALADAADVDLVVLAGFDGDGDFRVALHSRSADTFSLSLRASLAASPGARGAFVRQLVERISRYAGRDGVVIPEKVDAQVIPLLLGGNPVLNDYLFVVPSDEVPLVVNTGAEVTPARRGPPPGAIVAIVLGILGGAGTAAGIALATNPPGGAAAGP